MPTLTLAASMLAAIWSTIPLAPAFCPVPRQITFLNVLDQGNASQGRRAGFGIFVLSQVDPKNQFSLVARAVRCERDGDLHDAIATYSRIIKESGPNAWAQERLEWCQGLLEMGNKNLDRLLMAVRIAPAKFICTFYQDVMDCDSRTRRLMLHLLDTRIGEHPSDDAAFCLRGLVRQVNGQLLDAIQDYKFYLWNHPRDSEAYPFLAFAQKKAGDQYGAIESAHQFVRLDENSSFGKFYYCMFLMETGNNKDAEAIASLALKSHSSSGWAFFIRGVARGKQGAHAQAVEDLTCSMQEVGWWLQAARMRCLVRAAGGDLNGALADAEDIVARYPCAGAIRLRAWIHSMKCESTAAVSDWLQWLNYDRDKLAENEKTPVGNAINPFDISWNFGDLKIPSERQLALCGSYYAVAALLAGNRSKAAVFVNYPNCYEGDWRPCLARGLYHATGGEYALALRELRNAFQREYWTPQKAFPSLAQAPKGHEESKLAARDGSSYESFDEMMNAKGEPNNRRVSPNPVIGVPPAKPINSDSKQSGPRAISPEEPWSTRSACRAVEPK